MVASDGPKDMGSRLMQGVCRWPWAETVAGWVNRYAPAMMSGDSSGLRQYGDGSTEGEREADSGGGG